MAEKKPKPASPPAPPAPPKKPAHVVREHETRNQPRPRPNDPRRQG